MQLKQKDKEAIKELIAHTRMDLNYGDGGTFVNDKGDIDEEAIEKANKAIIILEKYIAVG